MPSIRKIQIRDNVKEKRTWTENFYIQTNGRGKQTGWGTVGKKRTIYIWYRTGKIYNAMASNFPSAYRWRGYQRTARAASDPL
jgi:hypothetical protein